MLRSLHARLSLVLLILLAVAGALLLPLLLSTTRLYNAEVGQHLNRDLASRLAVHLSEKSLLPARFPRDEKVREAAGREISHLMTLNPDIEIYVLDSEGAILATSIKAPVQKHSVRLDAVQRFLGGVGPLPILGDNPRQPDSRKVFSAARIPSAPNRLSGYVYIILGGEQYEAAAGRIRSSYALRAGAWSVAGVLGVTFVAAAILFGFLTRRLRRLTTLVEAFGASGASPSTSAPPAPLKIKSRDEIAALEDVFARMSGRVGAQVQTLEQSDAHRREAVSNVSHDLRTPLAALQGYLETLLMKEGQLAPDEQRKYLATALKHAERLGKLIAALFELAKLDSREMEPAWEDFSPGELAHDVAQQFQLTAQNKGVTLRAIDGEGMPFVRGDIALVERALENLLENALRHTPRGGSIEIMLATVRAGSGERIRFEVRDNGEGIAPEDLPHIFERSYRAKDTVRSTDSDTGAGLGLAISKRIAELHGGSLEVQSEPGAGAAFAFTLPLASSST
jgi:signal transduction histidine kinase